MEQVAAGEVELDLVAEELHHVPRELLAVVGRKEPQEAAIDALVSRGSYHLASKAHGFAAATRLCRRRASAATTTRPVPVRR